MERATTEYQIHTATGLMVKDRKLLVVRTPGQDFFKASGGKLDPGESAQQTVVRELKEELNVDVVESDLELMDTFYVPALGKGHEGETLRSDVFIVREWTGEPTPSREVEEIRWVESSDLAKIHFGNIIKLHAIPILKEKDLID